MRIRYYTFLSILLPVLVSCQQKIESLEDVMINGVSQKILIQGNTEKPLILYLHGGPGYSSILESQCYTDLLKQQSVFVQWDQRGTGNSFQENIDTATMSMEQFVEDTKELTDYLLKRFNKKKLYLAGHSWGSAVGFYTIEKYPEKYYAFIGAGQVISRKAHINTRINWVRKKMMESNDTVGLKALDKDIDTNLGFIYQYGGFMHVRIDIDSIQKASSYYSSKYADLSEAGAAFTTKYIPEAEQNKIDITQFTKVKVPVYFFLGKYDWTVPTSYAVNYLKTLEAPYKKIVWFDNSAHLMMMEEPIKFQQELLKIAVQ